MRRRGGDRAGEEGLRVVYGAEADEQVMQGATQRDRGIGQTRQRGAEGRLDLCGVALAERREDRLLVREVLVERADGDAGAGGDAVGRRARGPGGREQLCGGRQHRRDGLP